MVRFITDLKLLPWSDRLLGFHPQSGRSSWLRAYHARLVQSATPAGSRFLELLLQRTERCPPLSPLSSAFQEGAIAWGNFRPANNSTTPLMSDATSAMEGLVLRLFARRVNRPDDNDLPGRA